MKIARCIKFTSRLLSLCRRHFGRPFIIPTGLLNVLCEAEETNSEVVDASHTNESFESPFLASAYNNDDNFAE